MAPEHGREDEQPHQQWREEQLGGDHRRGQHRSPTNGHTAKYG